MEDNGITRDINDDNTFDDLSRAINDMVVKCGVKSLTDIVSEDMQESRDDLNICENEDICVVSDSISASIQDYTKESANITVTGILDAYLSVTGKNDLRGEACVTNHIPDYESLAEGMAVAISSWAESRDANNEKFVNNSCVGDVDAFLDSNENYLLINNDVINEVKIDNCDSDVTDKNDAIVGVSVAQTELIVKKNNNDKDCDSEDIKQNISNAIGVEERDELCEQNQEETNDVIIYHENNETSDNAENMEDIVDESEDEEDLGENPDFSDFDICQKILNCKTKYRLCVLHMKLLQNREIQIYATTLNQSGNNAEFIKVPNLISACLGAIDKDEVIIETVQDAIRMKGKVVHVYKRFENQSRHKVICECRQDGMSVIPIHNIDGEAIVVTSCNSIPNHMTLYKIERFGRLTFDHYEPNVTHGDYLYEVSFLTPESYVTGSKALITRQICKSQVNENILKAAQDISVDFSDDVNGAVDCVLQEYDQYQFDKDDMVDLRNEESFTILHEAQDGLTSLTFSIKASRENCHAVFIHIPDVASFVARETEVDQKAKERGLSIFVPGRSIVHMLPPQLVTEMWRPCSGKVRLVWSVMVTIDTSGSIVSYDVQHSLIRVNKIISYNEVDSILYDTNSHLFWKVNRLNEFAASLNNNRILKSKYRDHYKLFEEKGPAEMIIEEVTVLVNTLLTAKVIERFPENTPLLYQPQPDITDEWKAKYLDMTITAFIHKAEIAVEDIKREHSDNTKSDRDVVHRQNNEDIAVFSSRIKELHDIMTHINVSDGDLGAKLSNIANFPILQIAVKEKRSMLKREAFVCSDEGKRGHYSLNVNEYCTFTQPVHGYVDLVAQRLLSALMHNEESEYNTSEIDDVCADFNKAKSNAVECLDSLDQQHLMEALTTKPLSLLMIIEEISDTGLKLCHASLSTCASFTHFTFDLKFNKTAITEIPNLKETKDCVTMAWQERIYDTLFDTDLRSSIVKGVKQIDASQYVRRIRHSTAQRAVAASDGSDDVRECIEQIYNEVMSVSVPDSVKDVTSEVLENSGEPKLCDFSATFHVGDAIKVQIAENHGEVGRREPVLLSLSLTPTLDICIEHQTKQAAVFVAPPTLCVNLDSYPNIDVYKDTWKAVVLYESAESAVRVKEGSIIHNIHIKWEYNGNDVTGSFEMDKAFFEEQGRIIPRNGYICVRYRNIPVSNSADWPKSVADLYIGQPTITWIGHCTDVKMMIRAGENEKNHTTKFVQFRLHNSSTRFPSDVLLPEEGFKDYPATLEWLPTPRPYEHMINALNGMHDKDCVLAKDIALGEKPGIVADDKLDVPTEISLPNLAMNQLQCQAIRNAFEEPFALIHGPPGTGKTLTGTLLAYHFLSQNKKSENINLETDKWQVLYCTPSNKAADVVLDNFRKINALLDPDEKLNIIRVYNPRIEQMAYPIPGRQKNVEKSSFDMNPRNTDVALHHLIREHGTESMLNKLNIHDFIMKNQPDKVDEKYIRKYRDDVMKASKALLRTADVVVTTCTGAAAGRVVGGCRVRQVIIDEGGMSSEPESLIPIVNHSPKQVVVIGDHKQLETIVLTDAARDLGMKRSMFERYAHKAIMLITQYRMHEMIAKFPSDRFYSGKLECGKPEQKQPSHLPFWPGGASFPLAFCHIVGEESSQVVATKDGSEQSKKNEAEAMAAIRVAELLIRHGVNQSQIAVLTQYCAQQAVIRGILSERIGDTDDEEKVKVSTVIASQGNEWDYVIFSMVRSSTKFESGQSSQAWLRKSLGFITDEHQMNVSLTRARKGLILIGNGLLLGYHTIWGELIEWYKKNGAYVDYHRFVQRMERGLASH